MTKQVRSEIEYTILKVSEARNICYQAQLWQKGDCFGPKTGLEKYTSSTTESLRAQTSLIVFAC